MVKAEVCKTSISGSSPDAASNSMPPSLLLQLPPLPEGVRYRFVGQTLILYDSEANVILDFIVNAVRIGPSRGKGRRNLNAER